MKKTMRIKNLTKFTKCIAKDCCEIIGISFKDINQYISLKQAKNIVCQYAICKFGEIIITNEIIEKIHEEIYDWIWGVQLSKMCSNGDVDCYWNEEKNQMMFFESKKSEKKKDA